VAIHTYGREPAYDQATGRSVSTIKCTRAAPDILLALFGERARDLTPPRSYYRHIALDPVPSLKNSYLMLRLTREDLAQVEALTRPQPVGAWVYLWRDLKWHEFPHQGVNGEDVDYRPSNSSGPTFDPGSAVVLCPSQPERPQTKAQSITATQSGDGWRISGSTYPYRHRLKAAGARWSNRRKEWYVKGRSLPPVLAEKFIRSASNGPRTPTGS
jgi:hypothetical protein